MLAASVVGKRNIILEDRKVPDITPERNVLIKVLYCGICGSDISKYYHGTVKRYPLVMGHEICGQVVDGPEELLENYVSVIPMWYCGNCDYCLSENAQLCEHNLYMGSSIDGGMQEYIVVPQRYLYAWNMSNLSYLPLIALQEPFAVAIHAVRSLYEHLSGDSAKQVGIVGRGAIGRLVHLALKYHTGVDDERITFITRDDDPPENLFDYCFECSGQIGGLNKVIKSTKCRGTIMQLGLIYPEFFTSGEDFNFDRLVRKEQNLYGSYNSNYSSDWNLAYRYMMERPNSFLPICNTEYSLKDVVHAFESKNKIKPKTILRMG